MLLFTSTVNSQVIDLTGNDNTINGFLDLNYNDITISYTGTDPNNVQYLFTTYGLGICKLSLCRNYQSPLSTYSYYTTLRLYQNLPPLTGSDELTISSTTGNPIKFNRLEFYDSRKWYDLNPTFDICYETNTSPTNMNCLSYAEKTQLINGTMSLTTSMINISNFPNFKYALGNISTNNSWFLKSIDYMTVPLPGGMLLFLSGLMGLIGISRKT